MAIYNNDFKVRMNYLYIHECNRAIIGDSINKVIRSTQQS